MNKLRLLIASEQNDFDKKLSSTIKKFSSERNLFFANLYNNSINWSSNSNNYLNDAITNNCNNSINNNCEKNNSNKSFFRGTLLKRCKSSKDVYKSPDEKSQQQDNSDEKTKLSARQSFNLDEFDKKYLFSENRKNIVKELRKNFENFTENGNENVNDGNADNCESSSLVWTKPPIGSRQRQPTPFKKCEFYAKDLEKRLSLRENVNNNNYELSKQDHQREQEQEQHLKQPRKLSRHSFYLHRNESDVYEVGDGCDDCVRVKYKARQLIEMFGRAENHQKQHQEHQQHQQSNRNAITSEHNIEINNNNNNKFNTSIYIHNNNNNNQNELYNDNQQNDIKLHQNGVFITCNNLLNDHQKRRSLNVAITRDKNLYRNILSDSFEDSKYGIKKSGSVNKIDLEILKSELEDYVDPMWRANLALGYGFRSQRSLRTTNRKELDLEQKIDLEIKMREGSAKLLAACNNPKNSSGGSIISGNNGSNVHNTQMLEAAKNLLTSNERMTSYMAELQRRKRDRDTIAKAKPHGKVSLSEIRMPLMWRDSDHFKNKGDHRRFAVFCLAKIGTEIYDTSLLSPVDRNLTDVCFNDAILFTNVTPDFELKLEVYAVMMESDLSIASTPRKIKNTIHSSISRTVGKRLAANLKDELNNTKIGPKFELIATAHLTLTEASDLTHTHDLCLTPNNTTVHTNNKLPLFGHFCCRLAVQPDFYEQPTQTGNLCFLQKGPARPVEGYGRLQAFRIELWDDEKPFQANYQPRRSVDVNRETKLKLKGETDIVLANLEEGTLEEYVLRTNSSSDAQKWYSAIKKAIKEHSQWGHVVQCNEPMQLAIPGNSRNYCLRNSRQGSLYDQVPILETIDNNRQTSRPTVHDIFAIPTGDTSPTLNEFRNRAYSSGRSSSHSSSTLSASSVGSINSRKSHWPFSGNK